MITVWFLKAVDVTLATNIFGTYTQAFPECLATGSVHVQRGAINYDLLWSYQDWQ